MFDTRMLLWVSYKCCLQQLSGSWELYSALGNTRKFLRALLTCSFLQLNKRLVTTTCILLFAWYVRDYTCSIEITCSDHIYSFVPAATLLFTMKMKGVTSNSARCKLIKNSCTHIQKAFSPHRHPMSCHHPIVLHMQDAWVPGLCGWMWNMFSVVSLLLYWIGIADERDTALWNWVQRKM